VWSIAAARAWGRDGRARKHDAASCESDARAESIGDDCDGNGYASSSDANGADRNCGAPAYSTIHARSKRGKSRTPSCATRDAARG
jgi:hypothetical protein